MSNASRYQRRVRNGRTGSSAVIAEGFDLLIGGSRWVWIHLSVVHRGTASSVVFFFLRNQVDRYLV
jgi:hypothetical protein